MNTTQVVTSNPGIYVRKYQPRHFLFTPLGLSMNANPLSRTSMIPSAKPSSVLQCVAVLKSRKPLHVCLAGGKGMMDNSEDSQRISLEEAMKNLQEKIQKGEYNGGSGSKPPGGRGGGSGGSEDSGFSRMSDETLQIIFATIGFIFVYIYVINGIELTKLARDFIKYLLGGTQSVRLKRASYKWVRLYKKITGQNEVDENGLENAPTRWNVANFYRDVLRNYMKPNSNSSE
ncbi:uncharacterized protein [Cicer arietinum]|uniref:Uncharacterized protein LOC101494035 n=1 Tax=Cicer arietinum TaxID=3827 RepID=A0A1S2Z2T2_CICAR|nr:uncharacterized protein LOC101494035 [Cicer arietinum]XP_004514003.1 uncharacterized protein LOC101494035 [Cicer arietinum]